MKKTLALLSLLLWQTAYSQQPNPYHAESFVTDFSTLFKNDTHFSEVLNAVKNKQQSIEKYVSRKYNTAEDLLDVLAFESALRGQAGQLFLYGILKRNIDVESAVAQQQYEIGSSIHADVTARLTPVISNIKALGQARITQWLKTEPRLQPYQLKLNKILSQHINSEQDQLISYLERANRLSADAYVALMETPVGWPSLKLRDQEQRSLTPSTFRMFRRDADRNIRMKSSELFLNHMKQYSELMGVLYTRRIENDLRVAEMRGLQSGISSFWQTTEKMPANSHLKLIQVANENLPLLHTYLQLRAKVLSHAEVHFSDLYFTPELTVDKFIAADVIALTKTAVGAVDPTAAAKIQAVVDADLLHLAYAENKSSEWGILPGVLDSKPYLRMNYRGRYTDAKNLVGGLLTLATFNNRPQDLVFDGIDDSAIGGSIYLGQMLFNQHMRNQSTVVQDKIAYLLIDLDRIARTFFYNALQIELSMAVETKIAAGVIPSGEAISAMNLKLMEKYYGKTAIKDYMATEWMTNYVSFLSYATINWPASIAIAAAYTEQIDAGNQGVQATLFNEVNQTKTSDRAVDLLRENGLDLNKKSTFEYTTKRFKKLMKELESMTQ